MAVQETLLQGFRPEEVDPQQQFNQALQIAKQVPIDRRMETAEQYFERHGLKFPQDEQRANFASMVYGERISLYYPSPEPKEGEPKNASITAGDVNRVYDGIDRNLLDNPEMIKVARFIRDTMQAERQSGKAGTVLNRRTRQARVGAAYRRSNPSSAPQNEMGERTSDRRVTR